MTARTFRQLLATSLLLFISLESTALASILPDKTEATADYQLSVVHHELQVMFSLLAEQSEERDERNDFFDHSQRKVFHPCHFSLFRNKCIAEHEIAPNLRSVPIYTSYCAYLI